MQSLFRQVQQQCLFEPSPDPLTGRNFIHFMNYKLSPKCDYLRQPARSQSASQPAKEVKKQTITSSTTSWASHRPVCFFKGTGSGSRRRGSSSGSRNPIGITGRRTRWVAEDEKKNELQESRAVSVKCRKHYKLYPASRLPAKTSGRVIITF